VVRFGLLVIALAACGRLNFGEVDSVDGSPDPCPVTFCDDFDRTGAIVDGWDEITMSGGTLALVDGQLTAEAGDQGSAVLGKQLPMATASVRVDVDVEFAAGMNGEIDLLQLRWLTPPAPCGVFGYFFVRDRNGPVALQETYHCPAEMNINDDLPTFPSIAPSGRHHLSMEITIGAAGTATARVEIDGNPDVVTQLDMHDVPASAIELRLGIAFADDNTSAWLVRYDNLLVDVR
jgi:hypothetical protein